MGKDIIENKIRDQVYHHETLIDNDQLWNAIQRKQNKRRPFFYWLLSGLMLFALGGYAYSYFNIANENSNIEASSFAQTTETTPTLNKNSNTDLTQTATPLAQDAVSSTDQQKNIKPTENLKTVTESKKTKTHSTTSRKKNNQKQSFVSSISNSTTSNSTSALQKLAAATTPVVTPTFAAKAEVSKTTAAPKTQNLVSSTKSKTASPSSLRFGLSDLQNIDDRYSALSGYSRMANPLSRRVLKTKRSLKRQIDCYDHSRKKNPLYVLAYAGPAYVMKSLSNATTNTEVNDYIQLREETERVLEGWRTGLMLKYVHKSGVYGKFGIEWMRINEKMEYGETEETTVIETQIVKWIVNEQGDSNAITGPVTVTYTKSTNWEIFNKYTFVNVPLMLGYQQEKGKWTYAAEAGVIINNSFKFSGMIINDQNAIDEPNHFRSKIGLSLTAGVGMGYSLTDNLKLWMTPSLKYDLGNVNENNYSINQRYTSIGLLAGLEFRF